MKKITLCFTLFVTCQCALYAQSDCNNYLDNAQKMYNKGQFDGAIAAIKNCSGTETNTVTQWQSSRLLAQCYLGLNDLSKASLAAEDMLDKNPLYKTSVIEDSKEFVNLLKKVLVVPRFSLSLSAAAGVNISYPNIMTSYGVTNDKKTYSNGKAKQIGLFTSYSQSSKLSFQTGIMYAVNNYSLEYKVQNINFNYDESLTYLQIPLVAKYQIKPKGNFKVFAQAGLFTGFLTNAKYGISRKIEFDTTQLTNIEHTDSRSKTIFGIIGEIGRAHV